MTENKQITIYELLPLLKPGWVAMDECRVWWWYTQKPEPHDSVWIVENNFYRAINEIFNIAPFDGDWKDSLIEVK